MAVTFAQFDTTPAGAVAAIKAAILASTDWSNPAGDRVICTTTRGAAMVVDLADAAASVATLQFGVYRTTGLADKIIRYLRWRVSGGATSDPLHCAVSAGKDHLFITVEGPRAGEPNPDVAAGSHRPVFWLSDLVPYFASDTIAAVVCGGSVSSSAPGTATSSHVSVHVSRNLANNSSWASGILETLGFPVAAAAGAARLGGPSLANGAPMVRPYLLLEDVAGLRGRLAAIFNMGWNGIGSFGGDVPAQPFSRITIGSGTYIGLPVLRQTNSYCSFGGVGSSDPSGLSPIVAVPYA